MSGMFQSTKTTPEYVTTYDPFKDLRGKTTEYLSGQIGKAAPTYSGELVAPKTTQEGQSLDWLKKYADQGTSEGMNLANEEVRKTMTGYYDPSSSPYYQAVKAESARNLANTNQDIASQSAGGGRYWGGARLEQQREAGTDVANSLNTMLGQMAEQERMNRLNTVPIAAQLGQYEENVPLAKTQALQQYGSLDRTLQQANDEAIYNEWLRSTQDYPLQIAQLAQGLAAQQPIMSQVKNQRSLWSFITDPGSSMMGYNNLYGVK
jgi:hypothetical protein